MDGPNRSFTLFSNLAVFFSLSPGISFVVDVNKLLSFRRMLRSKAPSALKRRKDGQNESNIATNIENKLGPTLGGENRKPKRLCTLKRLPLSPVRSQFNFAPNTKNSNLIIEEKSEHEDLIKKILNRPFKIPINNYSGMYFSKLLRKLYF